MVQCGGTDCWIGAQTSVRIPGQSVRGEVNSPTTCSNVPAHASLWVKKLDVMLNIFFIVAGIEECSNSELAVGPLGLLTTAEPSRETQEKHSMINTNEKTIFAESRKKNSILTSPLLNPRRDHYCRHTDSKPIELEKVRGRASVPIGVRNITKWSLDMIIEASVLIVGDDQQSLIPLRASSQCLVDLLDQLLPVGDIMGWVIVISRQTHNVKVSWLDHC